ncbi:MAG: ROK family protein, partial [Candidatus Neomarinimicrobiota bacterium]
IERQLGEEGTVGVGIPGIVSADTGLVKNANSTWLNGHPLDRELASALGRPVKVTNDANCFALSEAIDGAGAGAEVVFGVILGTGVGAGVVVNGRPLSGVNDIAGEWGHNPLPQPQPEEVPGPNCYCGRRGCVETFLSGPALAGQYIAATGITIPASELDQRAQSGDAVAENLLELYCDRLARSLAVVINILDPQIIVLGGGLSNIRRLYEDVPRLWARYVFSDQVHTTLAPAMHGDSSGVRGAAWL